MAQPFAFHDLAAEVFPFTIELWGPGVSRQGPPTWSQVVDGPGSVSVPGLGEGAWARVLYADGEVAVLPPPGGDPAGF